MRRGENGILWDRARGGRTDHAWDRCVDGNVQMFRAVCDPTMSRTPHSWSNSPKRCQKCERLLARRAEDNCAQHERHDSEKAPSKDRAR